MTFLAEPFRVAYVKQVLFAFWGSDLGCADVLTHADDEYFFLTLMLYGGVASSPCYGGVSEEFNGL